MRHDHPMKPDTPDACCCGPDVSLRAGTVPPGAADRERGTGRRRGRAPVPFGQRPRAGCRSECRWTPGPGARPAPHPAQGRGRPHPRPRHRRLRAGGCADRGRQDPRSPAERRNFERRRSGDRRHQSHRGAGLHRHASPFLPGPAAEHPHQRPAQSRLQSRHRQYAHTGLCARGCLCRRARHGARHDRHGHHHRRRHVAGLAYTGAQRRLHSCIAGVRHARGLRLLARQRTRHALPAGYRAAATHIFQLAGPVADAGARRRARHQRLHLCTRGRRALRLPRREQQHRTHPARARARRAAAARR